MLEEDFLSDIVADEVAVFEKITSKHFSWKTGLNGLLHTAKSGAAAGISLARKSTRIPNSNAQLQSVVPEMLLQIL